MPRFTFATWGAKSRFRVINKKSLLAFFDFVDGETGLEYLDWQLISGKNGRFVASPGKEAYENKDGVMIYPKLVAPAFDGAEKSKRNQRGEAFFTELTEVASAEYDRLSGTTGPTAATKRSGAGPLKMAVPPDLDGPPDDEDNDLPF